MLMIRQDLQTPIFLLLSIMPIIQQTIPPILMDLMILEIPKEEAKLGSKTFLRIYLGLEVVWVMNNLLDLNRLQCKFKSASNKLSTEQSR